MKTRWKLVAILIASTLLIAVSSNAGLVRDLSKFWFAKNQNTITTDYNVDVPGIEVDTIDIGAISIDTIATTVGDPGSDGSLVTEQATRESIDLLLAKLDLADSLLDTYGLSVGKLNTTSVWADSSNLKKDDGTLGSSITYEEVERLKLDTNTPVYLTSQGGVQSVSIEAENINDRASLNLPLKAMTTIVGVDTLSYDFSTYATTGDVFGCAISDSSLFFDGTDRIEVADRASLDFTGAFSIVAWIRAASLASDLVICDKGVSSDNRYLMIHEATGYIAAGIDAIVSGQESTIAIPINTWGLAIAVFNGVGTWTYYINGVAAGSHTEANGPFTGNNAKLTLGRYAYASLNYYNGDVAGFKMYNRALTLTEAQTLYAQGR